MESKAVPRTASNPLYESEILPAQKIPPPFVKDRQHEAISQIKFGRNAFVASVIEAVCISNHLVQPDVNASIALHFTLYSREFHLQIISYRQFRQQLIHPAIVPIEGTLLHRIRKANYAVKRLLIPTS